MNLRSVHVVVVPLGLLVLFLWTAARQDMRVASCGVSWKREQGTFSCGDHEVSFAALAEFPQLRVLLLEHVTLVESPTVETLLSEGFVIASRAAGRDLTAVEHLGVQTMTVPESLMRRLPNLRVLTMSDVDFDFSWLRFTPALKRLYVSRMNVSTALPIVELPNLEEVELVIVPNAAEIARAIHAARPEIKVRVFLR